MGSVTGNTTCTFPWDFILQKILDLKLCLSDIISL